MDGQDRPPLVAYTTAPTAHGDVVSATPDYREWFLRAYPAARRANQIGVPPSCAPLKGVGGEAAPGRFKQNAEISSYIERAA